MSSVFEIPLLIAAVVFLAAGIACILGGLLQPGTEVGIGVFRFKLKILSLIFAMDGLLMMVMSPLVKALERIPDGFYSPATAGMMLAMTPFVFLIGGWVWLSQHIKIPERLDSIVMGVLMVAMIAAVAAALYFAAEHLAVTPG